MASPNPGQVPYAVGRGQRLKELVENRVCRAGPHSELSIYDTYAPAREVSLSSGELLYCGMISGRKILHGRSEFEAEFLPRESFVMAPGETVAIDFPDASMQTPTSCLTIEISRQRVARICDSLNQHSPLDADFGDWRFRPENLIHTPHSLATQSLLERLVETFFENATDRDLLIDLGVSELVVRMLRYQTRAFLLSYCQTTPDANGLTMAIQHLRENLGKPFDIDQLCRLACMSRTRFFNAFKKHVGCSPAEFHQQLRMQEACSRLRGGESVTAVCYALGYQNLSHFSRRFHQFFGVSPRRYQQRSRQGILDEVRGQPSDGSRAGA